MHPNTNLHTAKAVTLLKDPYNIPAMVDLHHNHLLTTATK
jgi:hypothetical protein